MHQGAKDTKLAIILVAGELFAEYGLAGTSIRTIAEKAGVNSAAINYHFGSKENLYTETLRYAVMHMRKMESLEAFENGSIDHDPEKLRAIFYRYIKETLSNLLPPRKFDWFVKLVIRSLLEPVPSFRTLTEEVFRPNLLELTRLIRLINPKISAEKALLWAFSIEGQIAFYAICQLPILISLGKNEYDPAFIAAAAEHMASSTLTALSQSPLDEG
jgi:AcrR family transcriptional regulator